MKKTKEMFAGGFYLLRGQSSANSSFIEDKEEAMKFITECNKRLSGFAVIHEYLLTKDGWILIISLLDAKTIKASYKANWNRSRKAKEACFLTDVWRIISEQIRQIRFTFVIYSNKKNGREGSKVKRSYERFWFESIEEAQGTILKLKKQLVDLSQKRKTYHSKKSHFRIPRSEGKGAIFLCSLKATSKAKGTDFVGVDRYFLLKNADVLRQLIDKTLSLHFPTHKTSHIPQLE